MMTSATSRSGVALALSYGHAQARAAILEMGFLSQEDDREVLLGKQSVVARGIADGILRFLAAKPQSALFGQDIVVETVAPPK